jgi:hypothetical protein
LNLLKNNNISYTLEVKVVWAGIRFVLLIKNNKKYIIFI